MVKRQDEFADMFQKIREQMVAVILEKLDKLGGKISFRHYHDNDITDRYSFYESNDGAYEIFLDRVEPDENGNPVFHLVDWEDSADFEHELTEFSASDILDILSEIENIEEYLEKSGEELVTEYDPDEDGEEYDEAYDREKETKERPWDNK